MTNGIQQMACRKGRLKREAGGRLLRGARAVVERTVLAAVALAAETGHGQDQSDPGSLPEELALSCWSGRTMVESANGRADMPGCGPSPVSASTVRCSVPPDVDAFLPSPSPCPTSPSTPVASPAPAHPSFSVSSQHDLRSAALQPDNVRPLLPSGPFSSPPPPALTPQR